MGIDGSPPRKLQRPFFKKLGVEALHFRFDGLFGATGERAGQ